ncbi:MAG: flavin reductase family protein [Clostridium sp.]|nr:flavin reductase family protein [Clostridium sp.]
MKKEIDVLDYAKEIMKAVEKGVLLTTKTDGKVNSMTISWGTLGIEWGKPIFTAFVRESRFSRENLDKNPEFTINMPVGEFDKKILSVCGSKSGRDMDKIKDLNLTLEEPKNISVPAIKELPLTLECKVIYKQEQDLKAMTKENADKFYAANEAGKIDMHIVYCAEIVSAYIVE